MAGEGDLVALRLRRGCRSFAARLQNQVVAYGWLSSSAEWIGELGIEIRPSAGEAYVWNCVTLPQHRRRGFFRALLFHVTAAARLEGLSRLWIGSVDGGAESAVIAAGFVPVLHFRVLSLAGLRWLEVRAAEGAGRDTVAAALATVGAGRQRRSTLGRFRRRRH